MEKMWAKKLGLITFDKNLFEELESLMIKTSIDYTLFFRELSSVPEEIETLKKSFYDDTLDEYTLHKWTQWFTKWKSCIDVDSKKCKDELSKQMKQINPKYTLREWILVPAYQKAKEGDYSMIRELQEVMNDPYSEQSREIEKKYYLKKEKELFDIGGISHISCSS